MLSEFIAFLILDTNELYTPAAGVLLFSLSILTTCWLFAIILDFVVVFLFLSAMMPPMLIFEAFSSCIRVFPSLSLPISPNNWTFGPKLLMFTATLAAPPGTSYSLYTFTTGTGASGEVL